MELNEKISIIVPVYKVEAYFDRCLKSIVSQSYQNLGGMYHGEKFNKRNCSYI